MLPQSEIDEALMAVLARPREDIEPHDEAELEEWEPPLTPSGRVAYYDNRKIILMHGERGSGKTLCAEHKGVRHCYLHDDALYMIVTITRSGGVIGGAWENLTTDADISDGPLKGQPLGILRMWEENLGLEWGNFTSGVTEQPGVPYRDDAKNLWVDIKNIHGGISRIVFKSMLNPSQLVNRIKDFKPSLFHMEELTNTTDDSYFTAVFQQIGRRSSVPVKAQQWMATCNPATIGQKHWVFKQFFVLPHDLKDGASEKVDSHEFDYVKDVVKHHPDYGVHHLKMTENDFFPDKEEYIKSIYETARSDPTEVERAIHGRWVPKITGNSLFYGYFEKSIHVKGTPRYGLDPIIGEPIIIGYDPGAVNNSRVFMQRNWSEGRAYYRVFDVSIFKDKKISINLLVKLLLDKMAWWCERYDHPFTFYHISDRQALDQYNPHGSYEFREYYLKSKEMIESNPKYRLLSPIRMQAPPKGADSVRERVLSVKNKLQDETLFVSGSGCDPVIDMFTGLRKASDRTTKEELDDKPLKAVDGYIHTFDALSYPIYYMDLQGFGGRRERDRKNKLAMVSG